MTLLTGSRLPIAQHCGWAFRDDVKYPERPRTEAADTGHETHAVLAAFINRQGPVGVSPVAHELAHVAMEWWPHMARREFEAEVAFAYNLDTRKARVLGRDIGREYEKHGAGPRDVCCSTDYNGPLAPGVGLVGDWKTGFAAHVEPVMSNLQLKFGGMCHAMVHGEDAVELEIARISLGGVRAETCRLGAFELSLMQSQLHDIVDSIAVSEASMGDHCTWCPALGGCPATKASLDLVGPRTAAQWTTAFISLANDAAMAESLSPLKKAVELVEDALKARYAGTGGLVLSNGKVWKEITVKGRESMDQKKVAELLGDRVKECIRVGAETTRFMQVKP
jgi:hypothetical protein